MAGSERVMYQILVVFVSCLATAVGVEVWCDVNAEICDFTLVIDNEATMLDPDNRNLMQTYNGRIYAASVTDFENATPVPEDIIITADGTTPPRILMTYNGTLPGPVLHVYHMQRVRFLVINHLVHETTTVHIHGMFQQESPFSDGVPFVTQCPILPGQTYVQNFVANPEGTFWYHSHSGPQLSNGLTGAFIVHARPGQEPEFREVVGDASVEEREHVILVQEWNPLWDSNSDEVFIGRGVYIGDSIEEYISPTTFVGSRYGGLFINSLLFNGRGQVYTDGVSNGAPLTRFPVRRNTWNRLRLIHGGSLFPFRISIDGHPMHVVMTEGHLLQPVEVESIIMSPGERYDVLIYTDKTVRNYWIRGETLQEGANVTGTAILSYEGADTEGSPATNSDDCTPSRPCITLNCPWLFYPEGTNRECLTFNNMRSLKPNDELLTRLTPDKNFFLNFGLPRLSSSVNGKSFVNHPFPPIAMPGKSPLNCDGCGPDDFCDCPNEIQIDNGDLVQMVFSSLGGGGPPQDHPIHLHGHHFYVVKMGFPEFDPVTGERLASTSDINCSPLPFCNNPSWADPSWNSGDIPGLEIRNAPGKDSLFIPFGGYAVIRFFANNPGLWLLHCHMEAHLIGGMAILVNESMPLWPKPPPDFPTCGSFEDATDYVAVNMRRRQGLSSRLYRYQTELNNQRPQNRNNQRPQNRNNQRPRNNNSRRRRNRRQ